jgi:hypothetical protein
MKRATWILMVLGILCLGASAAQAHGGYYDWHRGPYCGPHHGVVYGPAVVRRPVWVAPRVVVPVAPPPRVVYPPVYRYRCYGPVPNGGVYLNTPGLSIGVGW